jgi:eukaryotic-like serine/threonine-protein kinase
MPLHAGTRLGAYEVVSPLGAGGMGEVYRARDTRLQRDVAIKVLHGIVAADPERLARFEQEARATAALNHPNILAVYDLGQHDDAPFIVSELLEGQSLREVLAEGPLSPRKAIELGVMIAQGLAAAHEKGIVHRDLKPDNIFITADGRAKILDFGLAKLTQPEASVVGMTVMPTTPAFTAMPNTVAGVVLGTMGYMSPEQVRGGVADHRSDIFALGVVLHEMLSGRRAFHGESAADIMSGILKEDPPELPIEQRHIPPSLARIVNRCLEKNPAARFQSARDLAFALEALTSPSGSTAIVPVMPAASHDRAIPAIGAGALALVVAVVAAAATWFSMPRPTADAAVARVAIALPGDDAFDEPDSPDFAITRDGRTVAYVALHDRRRTLFVRALDSAVAQPLAGTEGAGSPFFSPDGGSVAFFASGKLRAITVASAAMRTVADAPFPRGGWWGEDGFIYFAPVNNSGIVKVPAGGGSTTVVTTPDRGKGEISHRWPQLLPGDKALLLTVWTGPGRDNHRVAVVDLATHEQRTVVEGGESGQYVATGHIVYGRLEALMAIPFDVDRLTATGDAVRTGDSVWIGGEGAAFIASANGTLLHIPGDPHRLDTRVVWVDRGGHLDPVALPVQDLANARLAPDGRRAAFNVHGATDEIAVLDFERNTMSPLTSGTDGSQAPVWSPDGRRIVYRGTRGGFRNLFWRAADGSGAEMRLITTDHLQTPTSWSADGTRLLFNDTDSQAGGGDVRILTLADGTITTVVASPAVEEDGQWSPDQRWIAYVGQESGRSEVFVQPFPATGERWRISTAGGHEPLWSPDGRELFYRDFKRLMVVDVQTSGRFHASAPRALFDDVFVPNPNSVTGYSISADGRRFLFPQRLQPAPAPRALDVVLNWFTDLRRVTGAK